MARLFGPAQAERVFYYTSGSRKGQVVPNGTPVPLYADNQCSLPADVVGLDGSPLAVDGAVPQVLIADTLEVPRFLFPDVPDPVVYTRVLGGPVFALHPDPDSRLDGFQATLDGAVGDVAAAVDDVAGAVATSAAAVEAVDAAVATFASQSAAVTALPTSYAGLAGNIQATVRKLQDAVGDVTVLVLGDSVASLTQWPDYLLPQVQQLYPARSLRKWFWNSSTNQYDGPTTIATGTGTGWINFYHGAQGGTVPESMFGTYWDARIASVQPDLVMIHYGHNYGASASGGGHPSDTVMDQVTKERFLRFACEVRRSCPTADMVLSSQNPYLTAGTRTGVSTVRAQQWRDIAADLGCAYGPVLEAYLATPDPTVYLGADLLHPNSAGAQLGASALLPLFRYQQHQPPSARVASPLLTTAPNLLTNSLFADFASPPTLPSWTAQNVTLSKNTTQYETGSWSLQVAAAAGSGSAQVYQTSPPINMARIKGQVVTALARVWLPTASTVNAARVQITGGGGIVSTTSGGVSLAKDQWIWVWATTRIPIGATFITVSLSCGSAGSGDVMYVDRAGLVLGHLPRDIA